jgi:hypothetical protein
MTSLIPIFMIMFYLLSIRLNYILIYLTGMAAQHMALLSLPPPLPPHARPVADYEGQEVSLPPAVLHRQHHHDHPQGVVINPPPQPQQEVVIDLVSDDDE